MRNYCGFLLLQPKGLHKLLVCSVRVCGVQSRRVLRRFRAVVFWWSRAYAK